MNYSASKNKSMTLCRRKRLVAYCVSSKKMMFQILLNEEHRKIEAKESLLLWTCFRLMNVFFFFSTFLLSTTAHKTHKKKRKFFSQTHKRKRNFPEVPAITKVLSQRDQPCGGLDKHSTREITWRPYKT